MRVPRSQLDRFSGLPRPAPAPKAARKASSPAETRRAAGAALWPRLNQLQEVVLGFIKARGAEGATDEEIHRLLVMRPDTARARRCELRDRGLIVASGETRPSSTGRDMTVWTVPEHAAEISTGPGGVAGRGQARDISGETGAGSPAASTGAAARASTETRPAGPEACPVCAGRRWWLSIYGVWTCTGCHPPAVPELVVDRREGVEVPRANEAESCCP